MKFYKTKNAEVGEGVEATVLYHKDNGDELICVRSDWDSFEKLNPKAKECTIEESDKLIQKAKITLTIPRRKELRKTQKLTDEDILKEIDNDKTPTVNIIKSDNDDGQSLIYVEEIEIKSTEDFLQAQIAQSAELEPVVVEEKPQETVI
ncbi:hypothetical protein IPN35_01065 [Candidatus Peregrinibacteria bacterium]|nr:MAG: hypothetical protein IPN35_01065 [Candidatus Peregrinibacteria bacterium]